jgi:hypothetical protein
MEYWVKQAERGTGAHIGMFVDEQQLIEKEKEKENAYLGPTRGARVHM